MNKNYPNFDSLLAKNSDNEKFNPLRYALFDLRSCDNSTLSFYLGEVEGTINVMNYLGLITDEEWHRLIDEMYEVDLEAGD